MDVNIAKLTGTTAVPDHCVAVPLADASSSPVQCCVIVHTPRDGGASLIVLRETLDATIVLGGLVDAAGRVHRWLELWIQNVDLLADSVAAARDALSNDVLDTRWTKRHDSLVKLDSADVISTGWESEHPPALWINLADASVVERTDEESDLAWRLCQDDALLEKHGLPRYSTTLHRYLYNGEQAEAARFAAVTRDAPTNDRTTEVAAAEGLLALNPGGGLMLIRSLRAWSYEEFCDGLGSDDSAITDDSHRNGNGRLLLGRAGRSGRLVECLHLKLRMLADAMAAVRGYAQHAQAPLLNLRGDSFRVDMAGPSSGLPHLWTARAVLCETGDAIALPVQTSSLQYFVRARPGGLSIYQPTTSGQTIQGRGSLRLRKVHDEAGTCIVEGTLASDERIDAAESDLLWLRVSISGTRIDLYGHLKSDKALAAGEWRFRSVEQKLDARVVSELRGGEGAVIANVHFDVIPLLSTPSDLYAMSVLAARTLLVNHETTLATAVDELHSLARQVASEHDADVSLSIRVQDVLLNDDRWVESLGPQRLTNESMTAAAALGIIPLELWSRTLGALVRMVPGVGPDSICRDYGDAQAGGIHKVFDASCNDLAELLRCTRSLIVIDWNSNREIHSLVRRYISGTAAEPARSDGE